MAAKFTVYKDKRGEYRFNLKAANGEIIASGEGYPEKKLALKGIASVVKSAATAKIVDETGEEEAPKKAVRGSAKSKAEGEETAAPKRRGRKPKSE